MCKRARVTTLKLVVNNPQYESRREYLLNKAVQAYWRGQDRGSGVNYKDAALEFLTPLRAGSPQGLAQKVQILEDMVETERSAAEIAQFAASIADDALSMSRSYLNRAI